MARPNADSAKRLRLSVVDRLIEYSPPKPPSLQLHKEAVRRDLEWLLNTRRIAIPPDESLKELNKSVYIYGLPDFSSYRLRSKDDRAKLLRSLQSVLRLFEPRLANVRVVADENIEPGAHTLKFRIEGMLLTDPDPQPVFYETEIMQASGECKVKNAG